jgi:DNA-binding MarR family transcriptional regulator
MEARLHGDAGAEGSVQGAKTAGGRRRNWTFLTNHGAALLLIAQNPGIRLVDLAAGMGVSVRASQMIVSDLVEAGYLKRRRVGRRNAYTVLESLPLRHAALAQRATVAQLLQLLGGGAEHPA